MRVLLTVPLNHGGNIYFPGYVNVSDAVGAALVALGATEVPPIGTAWYVDALNGDNDNDGTSWDTPFLTMAKAFLQLTSGDSIFFIGKVKEQLSTPAQVFDVSIIGGGNRPRHADAEPAPVGGSSASTWTKPDSGAVETTPLLIVQQQGWVLSNFVMAGPTTAACVQLLRNLGAGNAERDASHAEFHRIRFASGRDGIESSGGAYNVGIYDCDFHNLDAWCIKHTSGAGVAASYRWQVKRNRFMLCGNWIGTFAGNSWEIHDNTVSQIASPGLNTSTGIGFNSVLRNAFDIAAGSFDPDGGFTGHATDVWSNYLTDAVETGLPTN